MRSYSALVYLILIISMTSSANAMTDQERELIRRLHDELVVVTKLVDAAEHAASENMRRQFYYSTLRKDLKEVQQGLFDALNERRREPRDLPLIHGVYR